MARFLVFFLCFLLCVNLCDASRRRRRRRRWNAADEAKKAVDTTAKAADQAARAAEDEAKRAAAAAEDQASRAAAAAEDAASRAAAAAEEQARRAAAAAEETARRAAAAAEDVARRAAAAAEDLASRAAAAAEDAASRASAAAEDLARRAAAAAEDAARRAAAAAEKFTKDAFNGLAECATNLKKCILAMINGVFKGLGLPSPISNPHGWKFCLKPQGLCVQLPSPSLKKPPWQWGAKLFCVDVMMMIDYWMSFVQAIFDAAMGALSWFLDKLTKVANAIMDFLNRALKLVAKVFEPLLAPVMQIFKPVVDAMQKVADAIGAWFREIFGFLDLDLLLNLPMIDFNFGWSFMQGGCFRIDSFSPGLDGCGIKEIYDALKAAFCALVNLNFDKFLKNIKSGIQAVVNFGKNLGGCFKVTTKGLEAVFDAFPFVKTTQSHICSGSIVSGIMAGIAALITAAAKALKSAFGWLISSMRWLTGAATKATRSNRSRGNRTDVVGIKSAVDVQGTEASNSQGPCWETAGDKTSKKTINNWSAMRKSVGLPLKYLHMATIALNYLFLYVQALKWAGGKIICFMVVKFVVVITDEAKVGKFHDLQFAIFYGSVLTMPFGSAAMDTLKKISPWLGQFPALGISWTTDCTGAAKYGTQKYHDDNIKKPGSKPSNRGQDNAVFLQALSLNPKFEVGWPAYPKVKWGLTVPVEFKPIWLMWVWVMAASVFIWFLGSQPLTDFQIEYDLCVFLPDMDRLEEDNGPALIDSPCSSSSDPFGGVSYKGDKKGEGWADDAIVDASAARSGPASKAKSKVQKYLSVYTKGSLQVAKSVIDMFRKGPWGFLAELIARLSLAVMFWGWVFAVCCTCRDGNYPEVDWKKYMPRPTSPYAGTYTR